MRQVIFFVIALLSVSHISAQFIQKRMAYFSGSLGIIKPSSYTRDLNKHPFMANAKGGRFVKHGLALGFELLYARYAEPHNRIARLQQPGSAWTEEGIVIDQYISIGVFGEYYTRIARNFYLVPEGFIHYLHNSYTDNGDIYSGGQPTGIWYSGGADFGYYSRLGANLSLCYFLKPTIALTIRGAEFELRLRRRANDVIFSAPLMVGIQYHFNP
jgi:hypothetical protein